ANSPRWANRTCSTCIRTRTTPSSTTIGLRCMTRRPHRMPGPRRSRFSVRSSRADMRWRLALVVLAAGAALMPLPTHFVERWYSQGVYPVIQSGLTTVSNLTSFALLDALIVLLLVAALTRTVNDLWRRGWIRGCFSIVRRAIVWIAALYVVFL